MYKVHYSQYQIKNLLGEDFPLCEVLYREGDHDMIGWVVDILDGEPGTVVQVRDEHSRTDTGTVATESDGYLRSWNQ